MAGDEISLRISPSHFGQCAYGASEIFWIISTRSPHFAHWYSYNGIVEAPLVISEQPLRRRDSAQRWAAGWVRGTSLACEFSSAANSVPSRKYTPATPWSVVR